MELVEQLVKLSELHRSGALSDAEFASAKARLIAKPDPVASIAPAEPVPIVPVLPAGNEPIGAPKWMKPWGWFLAWIGALGFCASAYVNWKDGHEEAGLLAGLLNPMFFIGMPFGIYWLARSGVLKAINESTLSETERASRGSFLSNESTMSEGDRRKYEQ